jgi:hypothetical protein
LFLLCQSEAIRAVDREVQPGPLSLACSANTDTDGRRIVLCPAGVHEALSTMTND